LATGPVELRYVGEAGGIEEALAGRARIPFSALTTGQMRGRAPWVVARNLVRMARGAAQAAAVLRAFRPAVVFITGGYVAAPVAWAAWRQRIPILIYLPDLTPGLAIRLTARLATRVAVSFEEVARYFPGKAVVTGYPVRPELLATDRSAARAALGLREDTAVVLVFGGSRGAHSINRALVRALPALLPRCQVLHISGQLDWPWVCRVGGELPKPLSQWYHSYPYLHEEMVQALAAADLVVARAGASVLGEFPAIGLPGILVPYPFAGQHQDLNARYLAEQGAALVVPDDHLPDRLAPTILTLLDEPERLAQMAAAARHLARPEAAAKIAGELRQLARHGAASAGPC
jgi:UDP-N-acetylglucosamine--N-acetylmuramyl-(pentapeptide) pyrophosphoryl-undecaprenol N-acetylglucosamine transferase